jgi:DNA invertase Pin-like site-specific DNA recombinase
VKYGYVRISADGQSVKVQTCQLAKIGCKKVFRTVHVSGTRTDRAHLCPLTEVLQPDDVLTVTRLDRLACSTRDPMNTLAAITECKAGFRP